MKIWGEVTFESRKHELELQMPLHLTTLKFSCGIQGQGQADTKECRNYMWLLEASQITTSEMSLL